MMFMMPMPPTISEIDAIAATNIASAPAEKFLDPQDLRHVLDGDVVVEGGRQPGSLSEQCTNIRFRLSQTPALVDLDEDGINTVGVHGVYAEQATPRGAKGYDDNVVLIPSGVGSPLLVQHADDGMRDLLQPDHGADRIRVAEQDACDGRSQQHQLGA